MNIAGLSWTRLLLEGSAVVVSILLAFAIDAAWDDRQQKQMDLAQFESLYGELQSHRQLLAEAVTAHRKTVEVGLELLGLLAEEPNSGDAARITELLDALTDSYRINVPFGSLETAISSGAIARMKDVELATRLANWPTAIEDLKEEQEMSSTILVVDFYAKLSQLVSLTDVYGRRLANPGMRGTGEVYEGIAVWDLPESLAPPDYSKLHGNTVITNDLMNVMGWAQASLGEALLADEMLQVLLTNLQACLTARDC